MDLIVGSENGKASSTDILNSTDTMTTKKLKKSETEHLLKRLVQAKWLNEVKHGVSNRTCKSSYQSKCQVSIPLLHTEWTFKHHGAGIKWLYYPWILCEYLVSYLTHIY